MTATRGPGPELQAAGRLADEASFRFYRDGDEHAILSLLEAAFGRWPGVEITVDPIEHLRWKLRSDVYLHHVVVEAGAEMVGVSLCWPRPTHTTRVPFVTQTGADLAIHPDYQSQSGLKAMRAFNKAIYDELFAIRIGGSSRHPAVIHSRATTRRGLFGNRVQVLERPFSLATALSRFRPRRGQSLQHAARSLRLLTQGLRGPGRNGVTPAEARSWSVRAVETFDDRIDPFWDEARSAFDYVMTRDAAYLNWRYCDPRAGKYTVFLAEEGRSLLGYAAVQVSRERGFLSDALVLPERLDVLDALVGAALGHLREAGVDLALAWLPAHHSYHPVLRRHGFLVRPTRTRELAYNILGDRPEEDFTFLSDPRTRVHFTAAIRTPCSAAMAKRDVQLNASTSDIAVSCRLVREGDEEQMLPVLEQAFDRWPSVELTVDPIDHLRWKLWSDVYHHHIVAEVGQKIVGMMLLWARPAKVRDHVLVPWIGADLAVHPDYQQLGILTAMREVREQSFRGALDFQIGGLSRHPAIAHGRVGRTDRYPIGNRVQVLERPLTPAAALSRFGPGVGRLIRSVARSSGRAGAIERTAWTVREIDSFNERVDRLWEEASASFDFMLLRNAEFLNWRYCDRRAGRHTVLLAEEAGRVLGYAAAQVSHGRGYLSDVLVLPGRLDVLDSLLEHATRRLKEAGVAVVIAWCPTLHPYSSVLRRHGYLVRPTRTRKLAYRPLHRRAEPELLFLQDPQARLHFTAGDVDVV